MLLYDNLCLSTPQAKLQMPGLFELSRRVPIGLAIEEIILIACKPEIENVR